MITAIIGLPGSGKTAFTTFLAYQYLKNNWDIVANYNLSFPNIKLEKLSDIYDVKDSAVFLDELWIWIDSRASSTKTNREATLNFLQKRKDGLEIFYTEQDFGQIDIRIRNITNTVIGCYKISPLIKNNGSYNQFFKFEVYNRELDGKYSLSTSKMINLAPFFKMYNTYEKIKI